MDSNYYTKEMINPQRVSPCVVCDFPLTHGHHMLSKKDWGDNDHQVRLRGRCHDLFHVVYDATVNSSEQQALALAGVRRVIGLEHPEIDKIFGLARKSLDLSMRVSRGIMEIARQEVEEQEAVS